MIPDEIADGRFVRPASAMHFGCWNRGEPLRAVGTNVLYDDRNPAGQLLEKPTQRSENWHIFPIWAEAQSNGESRLSREGIRRCHPKCLYTPDANLIGKFPCYSFGLWPKRKTGRGGAATWLGPTAAGDPVEAAKKKK